MKATMELKWFECYDSNDEHPMSSNKYGWTFTNYILKQKWIDEEGKEVWLEIPTEY